MDSLDFIDSTANMEHNFGSSHYDTGYRNLGVNEEEEEQYGQCLDRGRCFSKLQERNFPGRAGWMGHCTTFTSAFLCDPISTQLTHRGLRRSGLSFAFFLSQM